MHRARVGGPAFHVLRVMAVHVRVFDLRLGPAANREVEPWPAAQTRPPSRAAIGWTYFAAMMMILIGIFHTIAGLIAIIDDEFYVRTRNYVLQFDTTSGAGST